VIKLAFALGRANGFCYLRGPFCDRTSDKAHYGVLPRSTSATLSVIVFTKNRSGRSVMILFRARVIVEKLVSNTISQSAFKKSCIPGAGPLCRKSNAVRGDMGCVISQPGEPRPRGIWRKRASLGGCWTTAGSSLVRNGCSETFTSTSHPKRDASRLLKKSFCEAVGV
jgi:hypothetical protein